MKRGTKPRPSYLKVVSGNPGKRPLNQNEPQPVGDLKEAPAWFTPSQREGWDYAIEHAPAGLLKFIDRSVLAVWVVAEDMHRQASERLTATGMLVKAPHTGVPLQSPYMAIVNKQANIMLKAAAELGFTPSSRSTISVTPQRGNAFSNNGRRDY
jgi:P27 family predicted phage terminase small subunit